jgi:hypothetical protein
LRYLSFKPFRIYHVTQPPPEPDGPYDVFISYSRQDVDQAEALQEKLEAAGLTVWRDMTRLEMGNNAKFTIPAALRNSAAVVVIWSENALGSKWVRREAGYAEVAGKYLPLAVDGFEYKKLDEFLRDYVCGSLPTILADPVELKQKALALKAAPYAGLKIRHPEIRPESTFIGRKEMLDTLDAKLWQNDGGSAQTIVIRNNTDANVAMHGLGGVGKTVLARHYAWVHRKRYQGVWWLRAEERDTLFEDLTALGRRLGLAFAPDADPEEAARETLDHLAQMHTPKPWLLIYDNVEDKPLAQRFIPPENAHNLFTTRLTNWLGEADELRVDKFPRDTAIDFLLAQASPEENRDTAGRLADALGDLPLALAHARAYCKARHKPFD